MGTRPPSIATSVSVSVSMFAPFRLPGRCRRSHDSTIVRAIQLGSVLGTSSEIGSARTPRGRDRARVRDCLEYVDEHKLSLDDTVGKWLPDLPDANQVTLKMLANMTSGYVDYVTDPSFATATDVNCAPAPGCCRTRYSAATGPLSRIFPQEGSPSPWPSPVAQIRSPRTESWATTATRSFGPSARIWLPTMRRPARR